MNRTRIVVGLLLLCGLVVAIRGVGFERIFPRGEDLVVLSIDDAQYHARRATFTAENFPEILWFDPYLNHPQGAFVPWPPLYDFTLGGAIRMLGDADAVLAWAPVCLGLLTALVVFLIGRALGGASVGLAAVGIFALLPSSTIYTSVGNPDHHAFVALVAALLLGGHLAALAPRRIEGESPGPAWKWQAGLVAVRVAMLLTWHGSILYVVLAEGSAVLVAAGLGRREALRGQAVGCAIAGAVGFGALAMPHSAFGGPWSAVEFSRLQPSAYVGGAVVAGLGVGWLPRATGAAGRLTGVAIAGALVGATLAGLAWESLTAGWAYASRSEAFIAFNYEAQPLWRGGFRASTDLYGLFALLLPLTPVAGILLARPARLSAAGLFFSAWTAAVLALAVSNARYGSDFAPVAAVAFALLGGRALQVLRDRPPALRISAGIVACGLIPLAFHQSLGHLAPHAARSLASLRGARVVVKRPAQGLSRSVYSFVDRVRAATPETAGWDDPSQRPAYGIITPPTLGFIVNARGRRPTPAGNFGPYVGREGIEATNLFYLATTEPLALRAIRDLRVRYAITSDEGQAPKRLWHRLHHGDGATRPDRPALGHFRLVTESRQPGVPLGALRGATPNFVEVPYKLFEIVEGAILEVSGTAGEALVAEIEIESPTGRRFRYRSQSGIGESGVGRLRLPYSTDEPGRSDVARATGPYRVTRGDESWHVSVSDSQVRNGEILRAEGPR